MKLWLLKPQPDETLKKLPMNPWDPWYGRCFGMVVRAETEQAARVMASENAVDERKKRMNPWLLPEYTTCVELTSDGDKCVILRNVKWA